MNIMTAMRSGREVVLVLAGGAAASGNVAAPAAALPKASNA
jgi:hypothetical protein